MVTGPMITILFQIVGFIVVPPESRSHPNSDFRNKFGALHQSYTPNRERELYSMPFVHPSSTAHQNLLGSSLDFGH